GTIVMVGSTSSKKGDAGSSAYSASKFGLNGLSQSLFAEVRRHNIRVIMVYPSSVDITTGDKPEGGHGSRLCGEDVAAAILAAANLPPRALVREIELWATNPA